MDSDYEREWAGGNTEFSLSTNLNVTVASVAESDTSTDGNGKSADKMAYVERETPTLMLTPTVSTAITRSQSADGRQRKHDEVQQTLIQANNTD